MPTVPTIKEFVKTRPMFWLFALSFALWIFAFRGFLSDRLVLTHDARAYFEHIKFYLDNISRGVYPLWEMPKNWGVPFEFFLRRIGSFNPVFFIILIFHKIGIPYIHAYLAFLSLYYFIGMAGFYMLAKCVFKDSRIAFVAYLLLMFSSLGTRLFDSFIILIFVPAVWFFYFLAAFFQKQKKVYAAGLTFTAMILLTTYVPFYFLTIFLLFVICFSLLYFAQLKNLFLKSKDFLKDNKIFCCGCAIALLLSALPGMLFYLESAKGEVVFPIRHYGSTHENVMTIDMQRTTEGGIIPGVVTERLIADLKDFKLGTFYIPGFAYILLLMGLGLTINRRIIFLLVWCFGLFILGLTDATPLYRFLYDHIFYFKLFRNSQFFLWVSILPIMVLIVAEQFRLLLHYTPRTESEKRRTLVLLTIVHVGCAVFLFTQRDVIVSSYLVIIFSLVFFVSYFRGNLRPLHTSRISLRCLVFILFLVIAQPLEAYHYLRENARTRQHRYRYTDRYEDYFQIKPFPNEAQTKKMIERQKSVEVRDLYRRGDQRPIDHYYVEGKWLNFLKGKLNYSVVTEYLSRSKFLAYDRVERMDDKRLDIEKIERAFVKNQNVAFVPAEYRDDAPQENFRHQAPHADIIGTDSSQFQIVNLNTNTLRLKTRFDSRKFLVYNDSFHSEWQAFVNGQKAKLWRANFAFKGLWVPAGEQIVDLRYGAPWRYALNLFLLGVFQIMFWYLIWLSVKTYVPRFKNAY